ncbi:transposase [Gammaproteobacteria bacterium]
MIASQSSATQQLSDKDKLIVITERVGDVPLLIGQMIRMGLPEILDKHIPKHGKQRKLSWGWTAVIWLSYILSEGDHRKISVAQYVSEMANTLNALTGQPIETLDFDDDRLSHLLRHIGNINIWQAVERDLSEHCIEVYELQKEVVRCDPTTVSGHHKIKDDGLMQFGHTKDDPTLPQIKLAAASLDPLGIPLVTEVVSGENADDGLYRGLIERVKDTLKKTGLLFVGDCKMSALEIRAKIVEGGDFYLSPLPRTGITSKEIPEWINIGLEKDRNGALEPIFRENDKGKTVLAACGYEFERSQSAQIDDKTITWEERVIVVCSPAHAEQQEQGLEQRLEAARKAIENLTPPVGRGKRQFKEEDSLKEAIAAILKKYRVEGLLDVDYEQQCEVHTRYVGKGRGSANREQREIKRVRYQIIKVERNEEAITITCQHFGWKAFVTNTTITALSLNDAILTYRNEYRIERIFNRLKSYLNIAPLFVKRDDQIEGLTYLLTFGVRVLTLLEFVVRRSLQADKSRLPDLHPENRKKKTDKPTAERILKAFSNISLTIILDGVGNEVFRSLTPLSAVQQNILNRLGLEGIYGQLRNSG